MTYCSGRRISWSRCRVQIVAVWSALGAAHRSRRTPQSRCIHPADGVRFGQHAAQLGLSHHSADRRLPIFARQGILIASSAYYWLTDDLYNHCDDVTAVAFVLAARQDAGRFERHQFHVVRARQLVGLRPVGKSRQWRMELCRRIALFHQIGKQPRHFNWW